MTKEEKSMTGIMWVLLAILFVSVLKLAGGVTEITRKMMTFAKNVTDWWPKMNILPYWHGLTGYHPGESIWAIIWTLIYHTPTPKQLRHRRRNPALQGI
jgi:hypothetical protein